MAKATTKVAVAKCILDLNLYPRHHVEDTHVRNLMTAIMAGETLPPLVLEKDTNRIVDGAHRFTAYQRLYGEAYEVDAELRSYASDGELFKEAMFLNRRQVRPFDAHDHARCIIRGRELGMDDDTIRGQLALTKERYDTIVLTKIAVCGGLSTPIKLTSKDLAQREITPAQQEGDRRAGGMTPTYYVRQVINALENDLVLQPTPNLIAALQRLRPLIDEALARWAVEEQAAA